MDIKGAAVGSTEESEEHVTRNQKKGGLYYTVAESFREFCPEVMWKAQLVKRQTWIISWGDFQEKHWKLFLLLHAADCETCKKRDKLCENFLNKKEPRLDYLGSFWTIQMAKDNKIKRLIPKLWSSVKAKFVAGQCFTKTSETSKD